MKLNRIIIMLVIFYSLSKIDSFRSVTVSPNYTDNMTGLRKLLDAFKENELTVYFGYNYEHNVLISDPYSITMKDLFYGNYANHV